MEMDSITAFYAQAEENIAKALAKIRRIWYNKEKANDGNRAGNGQDRPALFRPQFCILHFEFCIYRRETP